MLRTLAWTLVAPMCTAILAQAGDGGIHVQRLQQQRDQQQLELRLKLQQQQDRAVWPAPNPSADFRRTQLERDQQQRQQQLLEQQSRSAAAPGASSDATSETVRRDLERERAAQAAIEQVRRFEAERRTDAESRRTDQNQPEH